LRRFRLAASDVDGWLVGSPFSLHPAHTQDEQLSAGRSTSSLLFIPFITTTPSITPLPPRKPTASSQQAANSDSWVIPSLTQRRGERKFGSKQQAAPNFPQRTRVALHTHSKASSFSSFCLVGQSVSSAVLSTPVRWIGQLENEIEKVTSRAVTAVVEPHVACFWRRTAGGAHPALHTAIMGNYSYNL